VLRIEENLTDSDENLTANDTDTEKNMLKDESQGEEVANLLNSQKDSAFED